jgi:hypothetical protein
MDERDSRLIPLLEQMRDLLAEDVRLRQVAMDEQRAFQQRAQQSIDDAARRQSRIWIATIVLLLLVWFGSSFVLPLLLGFGSLLRAGNGTTAVVPSSVDTSSFDGVYTLLEERSFQQARERVRAEPDPQRRVNGEQLLAWQAERFKNFVVRRGVIRSGVVLTQEFSLSDATRDGPTLSARAVWHEDIHDPGDASEERIAMKLEGDVLEFVMLDEEGVALDRVFLKRNGGAGQ